MIRQWVQENVFNIMNDVEQMVYAKKYISDHPDENAAQLLIDIANKYPNCMPDRYNIMNYPYLNTRPQDVADAWNNIAESQCKTEEQAVAMVQMIVDNVSSEFPIWKFFSTVQFGEPSGLVETWPVLWVTFPRIRSSLITEEDKVRLGLIQRTIRRLDELDNNRIS